MSDELRDLAVEAFVYGYPLVEGMNGQRLMLSSPVNPAASPVNMFGHVRVIVTAEMARTTTVVSPNVDTIYSPAFGVDVEHESCTSTRPRPVNAFWSLTMYDSPSFRPIINAIHRTSIGDRTEGLVYNDDGSLDIYIQVDEPTDTTKRANWLPAPESEFRPILRLYKPRNEAFDDDAWTLPPIRRIT